MEVNQGNKDEIEERVEIVVPDVIGLNIKEAEKILTEKGFEVKINNEVEGLNKENTNITNQTPSANISAYNKSCVYLDY